MPDLAFETLLWENGQAIVAGVDEAGRGPLAGPVVAAAVVLPRNCWIDGVDDSKKLSPKSREEVAAIIRTKSLSIGIGIVDHTTIDEINILRATMRAMEDAVASLTILPDHLLIDGPHYRNEGIPYTTIVDGDAKCFSIAAASIIAKVTRDRMMIQYDTMYPLYGFARHKGYGTREHIQALKKYGRCEIHRKTFHVNGISI